MDPIDRQVAIDALWKALYEYEDKTEKQFQESEDLDVGDWIEHRIFIQNMNDIDRQIILNLPSVQPEINTALYIDGFDDGYAQGKKDAQLERWIPCSERLPEKPDMYTVTDSKGDVVRFVFYDNESSRKYWMRCAKAWMPLPEPYKGG